MRLLRFLSMCTATLLCSASAFAQIDDWTGVRAAYDEARHAIHETEDGLSTRNPGQAWQIDFDTRGFLVEPAAAEWTWGLELASYGFEDAELFVGDSACASFEGGRVAYSWNDGLEEWYVNDTRGFEHGYTVHERPETTLDEPGVLTLKLRVRGDLKSKIHANQRGVAFLAESGGVVLNYAGLTVFDADGEELNAWFERTKEGLGLLVDEAGATYPLTIDPIAQEAYLKASNTGNEDQFGRAVAMSGDTVVVGASLEDSSSTGINGVQADDNALDSGAVYVFVRTGSTWSQQAYLKASNAGAGDQFGWSLDLAGDTLLVGARWEDSNATGVNGDESNNDAGQAGAAYVFVRSGTTWTQEAYLKAMNANGNDRFGFSVSVLDDTAIVGAWGEDGDSTGVGGDGSLNGTGESGAAYVFTRSGSTWSQEAYLKASNTGGSDFFGYTTALHGDTAVVGAYAEASNATGIDGNGSDNSAGSSGAAYVFVRSGTVWSHQAYVKASNTDETDRFSWSMDISGDTLVVGAQSEDSVATGVNGDQSDNSSLSTGAVYVFVRNGLAWSQQAYLKASHGEMSDRFGVAVSLTGDLLAVGANGEDSQATGAGGDELDNSAIDSGCAYIFARVGTSWNQQAYIKASNPGMGDRFGDDLAMSGSGLVVGAWREQSNATGVGGNQLDDSLNRAGAAYTFDLALPSIVSFCYGDGRGRSCKCGNNDTSNLGTGGCLNSNGTGAVLTSNGDTSVLSNDLQFDVTDAVPGALAVLTSGANALGNGIGILGLPESDGLRCVGVNFRRHGSRGLNAAGATGNSFGSFAGPPAGIIGQAGYVAGQTRYFQARYREDPLLGPCMFGTNTTQALAVTLVP